MDYRVLLLVLLATVLASGQGGGGKGGRPGGIGGGKRDASWELDATELRHYGEVRAVFADDHWQRTRGDREGFGRPGLIDPRFS